MSERAFSFETGVATHVGRVRAVNEDAYLVHDGAGVWAVADGLGGHSSGALASAAAVDALRTIQASPSAADLLGQCEAAALRANAVIRARATPGSVVGTTLVVLLIHQAHFACVWLGDSRLYLLRDQMIDQWTTDHTEVQDLLDAGAISPDQARTWPRRNVVTRALGVIPDPQFDRRDGGLRAGDTFVLCSDGLTNHVSGPEILAAAGGHRPQAAADALVRLTLERGASDNVTVVVVRLQNAREKTVLFSPGPRRSEPGAQT